MLVLRLINRFRLMNAEPDAGGTDTGAAAPAPAADTPAPAPVPAEAPAPAPAPAAAPADPMASTNAILDSLTEGKPDAKPPAPAPAPAPEPKPTDASAAPKPGEPAKPADIDLTPPEGMSERATQRWAQLTERAKQVPQLEQRATQAETQLTAVRELVNTSGLDANEFADMLDMARLFKSGDPKALQQLDGLRQDLATRLGVEVAGVDPLAAHADLKAEVENMTLTKERALEIARLRGKGRQADAVTQEQREAQQIRQSVDAGAKAIETELSKRAGQPGHEAKKAYIAQVLNDPARKQQLVSTYQPHQWAGVIMAMYDAYTPPVAAAPAGPQPLRPGAVRAGTAVRTGPVTSEGAVESAFDRLGL